MSVTDVIGDLLETVITFAVLIVLSILAFYVTVFVVSTGASLADYDPSGDFVVLSASLLVMAALLGGIPFGPSATSQTTDDEPRAGFE